MRVCKLFQRSKVTLFLRMTMTSRLPWLRYSDVISALDTPHVNIIHRNCERRASWRPDCFRRDKMRLTSMSMMLDSRRGMGTCAVGEAVDHNEKQLKDFSEIPGPTAFPFIGTLYTYLPFIGQYSFRRLHHNGFKKLQKFGPLVRENIVGDVTLLLLFDPKDVEAMYATEGRYPERRSHLALEKYRLDRPDMYNGGGLFPTSGETWWKVRSGSQKVMARPQCVRAHVPSIDQVCQDFVELVAHLRDPSTTKVPDFLHLLARLFLELTFVVGLDRRAGCLDHDFSSDSEGGRLLQAADMSNKAVLRTDNSLMLWKLFNTPLYRQLIRGQDTIYNVALQCVEEKEHLLAERLQAESVTSVLPDVGQADTNTDGIRNMSSERKGATVLEYFLTHSGLDKKDIVTIICDMLLAGSDTATFTMAFTLYHLATNPEKQELLAQETRGLLQESGGHVTERVLAKARYTKAVLKESMRLNPVSIGVSRIVSKEISLKGYRIPKGTVMVTQNQVMCRLPEYFPNPDSFIPERWLVTATTKSSTHGKKSSKDTINPFLSLPFGHGPRSCVGRRIAEQNMYAALIRLSARYCLGWTGPPLDCYSHLINEPDAPIELTFDERL
ncbi:cytochrome P450 302a1, mitochondrial-like [Oratosquilla oratoria]|uniref:cytochrome P450 302a1, mitochondrial-like n=1 Tax=Oratosquilla oratoria TaxID=337810 RepID=UPI003F7749FF